MRCIYCPDGKPPFTKEHVIPRGMGGGIIYPKASCERCKKIIHEIETYCMRGPFLSHRLKAGLVNNLQDLGHTLTMPIIKNGERYIEEFSIEDFPNYLVLPDLVGAPQIFTHGLGGALTPRSLNIWGIEDELRALHQKGNVLLVENFSMDKFGRAIAKIAHGFVAGKIGLENFEPMLPNYILGRGPDFGAYLIGKWPEDEMFRGPGLLHQIGYAFRRFQNRDYAVVRLRLFAEHDRTPIYEIVAGPLTKPIDDVLAPLGQQVVPASE